MIRFRVLMMMTALLATATAVHAQPVPYYPAQPFPYPLERVEELGAAVHQPECQPSTRWYFQAVQDGLAAAQRLRALCSTGEPAAYGYDANGKFHTGCCQAAQVSPGCAKDIHGNVHTARTGTLMLGCGINSDNGVCGNPALTAGKSPAAPCCCAKACTCCETCKVAKKETVQAQPAPGWNPFGVVRVQAQAPLTPTLQFPIANAPVYPPLTQCGPGYAQAVPMQAVRIVQVMQVAHQAKPVHLVTPDLEAHCERMQHHGDVIVLEGNVLLLCKKHAQPIRIEAQRVLVNMRDGSFTVESNARPITSTSFGVSSSTGLRSTIQLMPVPMPSTLTPVPPASAAPAMTPEMLHDLLKSLHNNIPY